LVCGWSCLVVVSAAESATETRVFTTVFWVWCVGVELKLGSEYDVAPDMRKSVGWKLYCFGVGDGLAVILHKFFVVCEHVQIGEVETSGSNEMRLLSGR
jgi:hypothetical protein